MGAETPISPAASEGRPVRRRFHVSFGEESSCYAGTYCRLFDEADSTFGSLEEHRDGAEVRQVQAGGLWLSLSRQVGHASRVAEFMRS